jgi:multiple antibiotic resistance protein
MDFIGETLTCFVALFAVVDIIGTLPIFIALTEKFKPEERTKSINMAITIAGTLMLIFFLLGNLLLNALGISFSSFKIAGGIILGILGLRLVLGYYEASEGDVKKKAQRYSVIAIVIGTPLITGPGVISTIIIQIQNYSFLPVLISIVLNLAVCWIILKMSTKIYQLIGMNVIQIVSKVMGMLLCAIGIQYISEGIRLVILAG